MECNVIEPMIGKVFVAVRGEEGDELLAFVEADGTRHEFWYEHDCCAGCAIEDIVGDLDDLVGSPIVAATEVVHGGLEDDYGTFTWTFYHFSTVKGTVTVRWYGSSNGYYSESVSFRVVNPDRTERRE